MEIFVPKKIQIIKYRRATHVAGKNDLYQEDWPHELLRYRKVLWQRFDPATERKIKNEK